MRHKPSVHFVGFVTTFGAGHPESARARLSNVQEGGKNGDSRFEAAAPGGGRIERCTGLASSK